MPTKCVYVTKDEDRWEPRWGWQKPPPKESLYRVNLTINGETHIVDQSKTAKQWILNLIELIHWAPALPAFLMANTIYHHSHWWEHALGHTQGVEFRMVGLILSPIVAFAGGLPAMAMHEFEGWQVAPFRSPEDKKCVNVQEYNNERLRRVNYRFIFVLQAWGFMLQNIAVFCVNGLNGFLVPTAIVFAYIGFADQRIPKEPHIFGNPAFPLSAVSLIVFILAASLNLCAFGFIGINIYQDQPEILRVVKAILPVTLIAIGGVIEGLLAETTFNQWLHGLAFFILNIGFWAEYGFLKTAGKAFAHGIVLYN